MAEPEGSGERIDGADRNTLSPETTTFRGGTMQNLLGAMISIGDGIASSLGETPIPKETVGLWLRSYVRALSQAEEEGACWDVSGARILSHLRAAQDLADAGRLMQNGN
jgi:hypothetical protein